VVDIQVDLSGPLFDGRWQRGMDQMVEEAQGEIAQQALERVQYFLDRSIKHPTPYYETQIIRQRRNDLEVVHDRGIVYGPWLEGTSRRNQSTRFKGYAAFRRAREAVAQLAPGIIQQVVARHLGRLR
jgi:hypothetical protein